jgi:phytanoyl-CoA hydroxylase
VLISPADSLDGSAALAAWAADGWARLGVCASPSTIAILRARVDAIMDGQLTCNRLFFQHDSPSGDYRDLTFGAGWVGPSRAYRKVEGLEHDPVIRSWIENPLFARLARAALGPDVTLYRAVLWNKCPSVDHGAGGTDLPWHQDGGRFWGLSAQPTLTIWTALDDVPVDSGCLELVPGSHRGGLATPEGGTIAESVIATHGSSRELVPAVAGEVVLLHNLVWHRSGRNRTAAPRRALSLALLPASTTCTRTRRAPRTFTPLYRSRDEVTNPASVAPTTEPRSL